MIIDTHCHYNLEPLVLDVASHLHKAQEHGVSAALVVGTSLESSEKAISLATQFPTLFAALGIHPEECDEFVNSVVVGDKYDQAVIDQKVLQLTSDLTELVKQAVQDENSKVIAIGEIGLDYYRLKTKGLKRQLISEMQKKLFVAQLNLAISDMLVPILHVRDQIARTDATAYSDVLEILTQTYTQNNTSPFILHCASGPQEYINKALSLGAYIGIAGHITYDSAGNLREMLRAVPPERVLLETDAPFLAPNEHKGEVCQPYLISQTAQFLQQTCGINLDIIKNNTLTLFPKMRVDS